MAQLSQFFMNHMMLCLAFMGILFLIAVNELFSQKQKAKEVSPQVAVDLINNADAVVIDLRDKESYKKGHIIDSIQATEEDFNQAKMQKYKAKALLLVCAKGLQSSALAAKIRAQGYEPCVLQGGVAAWVDAGFPLVK